MLATPTKAPSSLSDIYAKSCHYYAQNTLKVLESGDWVSLLELPSEWAYDQALLLCELDEESWVAWIPDHGEAVLCLRQFCPLW